MSDDRKKLLRRLKQDPDYDVGYGKPPEETRFRPGQSGNPNGRPRGAKNKPRHLGGARLKDIILREAQREIPVKKGEGTVSMPMAEAVVRSLSVKAVKGDPRSQRLFMELVARSEEADEAFQGEWAEAAIGYKVYWEKELERRKIEGITDLPPPFPHPDQILLDHDNDQVLFFGPRTLEEKAEIDRLIEQRPQVFDEYVELNKAIKGTDAPQELKRLKKLRDEKYDLLQYINMHDFDRLRAAGS